MSTVIVDFTGEDTERGIQTARQALEISIAGRELSWVFVVADDGLLSSHLAREACTLVTVAVGNAPAANHWSAGAQTVAEGRVLFFPNPPECLTLELSDLDLLDGSSVALVYGPHEPGHPADIRLVAFTFEAYAAVRGFNLGIRDPRHCLTDLVTRIVWATGEEARLIDPPDEPDGQYASPRAVIANLPTWRFRPPAAHPLVTVVMVVSDGFEPDSLASVRSQVLDDLEIIVLDTTQSSDVREWVESNSRSYLRFGLQDSIRYLALGNSSRDFDAAMALCRGRYLLFMTGRDLLLPWAAETCLRRFKPGTSAVAGPRVHFDPVTAELSRLAEPYTNSVAMIRRSTALALLRHGQPTSETFGSWPFFRPLLGGVEHTSVAFALSSTAQAQPARGLKWLTTVPKQDPVKVATPYLPDACVERFIVFKRYCVGKIDEIDAYERIVGTLASFGPQGAPQEEVAVVDQVSYADMARLARANIPYEIVAATAEASSGQYCRDAFQGLLAKHLDGLPATQMLRIEAVDAVCGPTTADGQPIAWASYRIGQQDPLNVALSSVLAAAPSGERAADSSVTYWSKSDLREANHA